MNRPRRKKVGEPPGVVVWAWFAVLLIAGADTGGSEAGLVATGAPERAFWAAWWSEDPRIAAAEPDDYGFVDGRGLLLGEAIGAAYDACRRGRGPRVYAKSIGEHFALKAYREGAPRRRAAVVDFDALAAVFFEELRVAPTATPREVTAAFLAQHPDHGGTCIDIDRLTGLYKAALAVARRHQNEAELAAAAAGHGHAKKRRTRARPGEGELFTEESGAIPKRKERRGRQARPLQNPTRGTEEV